MIAEPTAHQKTGGRHRNYSRVEWARSTLVADGAAMEGNARSGKPNPTRSRSSVCGSAGLRDRCQKVLGQLWVRQTLAEGVASSRSVSEPLPRAFQNAWYGAQSDIPTYESLLDSRDCHKDKWQRGLRLSRAGSFHIASTLSSHTTFRLAGGRLQRNDSHPRCHLGAKRATSKVPACIFQKALRGDERSPIMKRRRASHLGTATAGVQ